MINGDQSRGSLTLRSYFGRAVTEAVASPQRGDSQIRYSLVVSLRSAETAQLYNAIQAQITPEITIET